MRVVIDTNVIVAALLHPQRTPDRALVRLWERGATVLVDDRIAEEYRSVLARAKFAAIDPERRDTLLGRLLDGAERVICSAIAVAMIDEGDRAFAEVACSGCASAIVTGNARHFPAALGIEVLSPAALLLRLS